MFPDDTGAIAAGTDMAPTTQKRTRHRRDGGRLGSRLLHFLQRTSLILDGIGRARGRRVKERPDLNRDSRYENCFHDSFHRNRSSQRPPARAWLHSTGSSGATPAGRSPDEVWRSAQLRRPSTPYGRRRTRPDEGSTRTSTKLW